MYIKLLLPPVASASCCRLRHTAIKFSDFKIRNTLFDIFAFSDRVCIKLSKNRNCFSQRIMMNMKFPFICRNNKQ